VKDKIKDIKEVIRMIITQFFNLKRFFLLIKKDFYTQYKTYLTGLGAIFSILFIVNAASIISAKFWNFNLVFYPLTLFIGGFIFTSLSFNELYQEQSRTFYLTIPASTLEKFISKMLITSVGYVIVSLILYFLFSLIVFSLTTLFFRLAHTIFNPFHQTNWLCIRIYLITQSIFLFGAVYFKKNSLIKTILSIFIILILYILFFNGIVFLIYKITSINNQIYFSFDLFNILFKKSTNLPPIINNIKNIINYGNKIIFWFLLAPLLWTVTFFHLKEIEV